jgi:DNA-binding response OmpR family regulator
LQKILIVDDDRDLCNILSDQLKNAGYAVKAYTSSFEAVMAALDTHFDLVILDMIMPELDGLKVIRLLRKIFPNLPILGLTGYVGQGFMSQTLAHGVTCLSKPIHPDELLGEIKLQLDRKSNPSD